MKFKSAIRRSNGAALGDILTILGLVSMILLVGVGGLSLLFGSMRAGDRRAVEADDVDSAAADGEAVASEKATTEVEAATEVESDGEIVADEAGAADAAVAAGSEVAVEVVSEIEIKPDPATGMKWDITSFSVKAGSNVKVTLNNDCPIPLQHNLLILKPGTVQKVGALANAIMGTGMADGYIPASDDILHHTKLLNTKQSETLEFTAPAEAGDYPYICTFPGHWMMMQGTMHVVE